MRPWFGWVLLLLLVPGLAWAQVRIGAVGGFNLSKLAGDGPDNASYGRRSGFSAGIAGEVHIKDDVVLSLQPSYAQRGTKVSFELDGEAQDSLQVRLEYVDVTALVKILPDRGPAYFTSGLTVGFLNSAVVEVVDGDAAGKDIHESFASVDVAVVIGVGARITIHPGELNFELRYSQSLGNIANSDTDPFSAGLPPRVRSSGIQLAAMWLFQVGGS